MYSNWEATIVTCNIFDNLRCATQEMFLITQKLFFSRPKNYQIFSLLILVIWVYEDYLRKQLKEWSAEIFPCWISMTDIQNIVFWWNFISFVLL